MIIKTTYGRDVRLAAASGEWGTESWIPANGRNYFSEAGVPVTPSAVFGLPAVASVMRSPAEIIASMPFCTYDKGTVDTAEESWQWNLLHERPALETDTFQFFYDLLLSIEATQNGIVRKLKLTRGPNAGQVAELQVIDPQRVAIRRSKDDGSKLFDIYNGPGDVTEDLDTGEILHVRGFSPCAGAVAGTSLLDVHRDPLGSAIAMQRFEGDYFRNFAVPPIWFTGAANRGQAEDWVDFHNEKHQGVGMQGKIGALWGTADVKTIPISLKDAMFIEEKNMSIEDACRIWRWPRRLLEIGEIREAGIDLNVADAELLKLYVLPRVKRIERVLAADPDIYFDTPLYGEFLTASLERGDVHTRYDAYRLARQGGWVTANELRKRENFPPVEGGDDLQLTPVGGAPNPTNAQVTGEQRDRYVQLLSANGDASVDDYRELLTEIVGGAE